MPTDDHAHLQELPDEVLAHLARQHLLLSDLAAPLRLTATCADLRERLRGVTLEAEQCRLEWDRASSPGLNVSESGAALSVPFPQGWTSAKAKGWRSAMCSPLPILGRSSWEVRVCRSEGGYVQVGVCTADGSGAWGVSLYSGHSSYSTWVMGGMAPIAPPPDDHPSLAAAQGACIPAIGHRFKGDRQRDATGAVLQLSLDREAGTLAFGAASGLPPAEIRGFPSGAVLRPWVALYEPGDRGVIRRRPK